MNRNKQIINKSITAGTVTSGIGAQGADTKKTAEAAQQKADEDEQETATVAEEGMPAGMGDFSDDEFASDDFESGGELGGDDLGGESLGDDLGGGDEFAAGGDDFGDEFGDDLGGDEFASGGGDEFADDQFGGDLDFDAEGMAKGEGEAGCSEEGAGA